MKKSEFSESQIYEKVVANNGTEVSFAHINDSILGKTVYLVIETINMSSISVALVIKPAGNGIPVGDMLTLTYLRDL